MSFSPISLRARPEWVPYVAERTGLGWPVPRAQNVRIDWKTSMHGADTHARVIYETPGPRFVAAVVAPDIDAWLPSERRGLESRLAHEALVAVQAQVQAHNAVVQPIDNSPDDRVYLVETGHRVAEAVKACATPGAQPDAEELQAACRANLYAADIVIHNFNHALAK